MSTHNLCYLSRNKKNNVYPSQPQFYYIKVGFEGIKIIQVCFRDELRNVGHFIAQRLIITISLS